jgi:hypothetical protein
MPNPENIEEHKFKKGESGNPKGQTEERGDAAKGTLLG